MGMPHWHHRVQCQVDRKFSGSGQRSPFSAPEPCAPPQRPSIMGLTSWAGSQEPLMLIMSSYVARPHVLTDEFVPGYLGDSFGLFPFVHGDPLANRFDGPFLVRLIRKEVTHISGFPFGIESRDPDIPSC